MRKVLLLAGLIAVGGNTASAAPYYSSAPVANQASEQSGGWRLPRLWGKKEAATDPTFLYQQPVPDPTTTQRITSALTENVAVETARGWMAPKAEAPRSVRHLDNLSLNQPAGSPTPSLLVAMAQVREKQGDSTGARKVYMQALAVGPKDVSTLRELGHFEDRQNKLADAERYYAEAAKLAPQNPAVLNDLGLCLARQGKLAPSAQVLDQAIRLAPAKPLYRNNMATVMMELGNQQQAMQHLMAAHPPAAAYHNMGHLLQKSGETEGAIAHYAEALRLDPNLQAANVALAKLAPTAEANVPQTAMVAPHVIEPSFAPNQAQQQQDWASEPVPSVEPRAASKEPNFGPRLLPPME